MAMVRVTVDTNVIVSGLLFGGVPFKVIQAGLARRFTWVLSPPLITEIERVLGSKKFGLIHHEVEALVEPIFSQADVVVPTQSIDIIKRCSADNRVLECAVEGRCVAIVTGDHRDLLSLGQFRSIEIMSPRVFLSSAHLV